VFWHNRRDLHRRIRLRISLAPNRADITDYGTVAYDLELPKPVQLAGVLSRKTRAGAGSFDIDLPLAGTRGVECRRGNPNGSHTIVFTFANELTSVDGASATTMQ